MEHLPVVEGKEKGFLQHRVETTASGVILAKAGRNALYRISSSRKRETNFCGCSFPKKWRTEVRESLQSRRARFYRSTKIRFSLILPLRESCWGVPSPNPALRSLTAAATSPSERALQALSPRKVLKTARTAISSRSQHRRISLTAIQNDFLS